MEEDVEIEQLLKCNEAILNSVKYSVNHNTNVTFDQNLLIHNGDDFDNDERKNLSREIYGYRNEAPTTMAPDTFLTKNIKQDDIAYDDEVQELLDHQIINLTYVKSENVDDEVDSEDDSDCIIEDILGENKPKCGNSQKLQSHIDKQVLDKLNIARQLVYQKKSFFVNLGEVLQKELRENESRQRVIRHEIDRLCAKQSKPSNYINETRCFFKKFGIPYFKDSNGFVPPINADHKRKIEKKELHITSLPYTFYWTKCEQLKLMEAIKENIIVEKKEKLMKEINKRKEIMLKLQDSEKNEAELEIIKSQNEFESLKNKSFSDLLDDEDPNREFDWMQISFKHFTDIHSPDECRRYYHLLLKPTINREFWKTNEDKALIELAEKYNYQDWDTISKELGTNRTAYHCFVRYQTQLQGDDRFYQGKWTKEEDDKLLTVVNTSLIGGFIPWSKISAYVTNRTHSQIYNRWQQSLNPKLIKGKFSKEEDLFIISGMQIFGSSYKELSSILKNRTSSQIRDRYERNFLKKNSKSGTWSLEEDEQLLNLVELHGKSNWCLIAKQIGNRTRTQARQRYGIIQRMMAKNKGWDIYKVKRRSISTNDKYVATMQKQVEKIRKEYQEAEKMFKLSGIEKETFRLEKLKELKGKLYEKKSKTSQRKRKVLADHSDVNNQLIEFYKNSISTPLKHISYSDSSSINKYFNEISMMIKFFGCDIQLPTTIDEVRSNPRLDRNLKLFLRDVIKSKKNPNISCTNDNINTAKKLIEENNIDYVAPPFDDTILMNQWWHTSPIDVSKLNFNEFFKRTVFDYSYGMHNDIWTAKCTRSLVPISESNTQERLEEKNQHMYVTPNLLTLQGLRSIMLSRYRLKQIALGIDLTETDNMSTINNVSDVLLNIDKLKMEKYLQTLILLFTWPKGMSSISNPSRLHGAFNKKFIYSKSVSSSYKNKYLSKTSSLDEQSNYTETPILKNESHVEENLVVCRESQNQSDQGHIHKPYNLKEGKGVSKNKNMFNKTIEKGREDCLDKCVLQNTNKTYAQSSKRKREVIQEEVEHGTQEKESKFRETNEEDNHSVCDSSSSNVNILSDSLNYSNKNDSHKMNDSNSESSNTFITELGLSNLDSLEKNCDQLRKRILKKNNIPLPNKYAKL